MADDVLPELRCTTVAASEAKNQFGQVLETAPGDGAVVITKPDTPEAIVVSIEELDAVAARGPARRARPRVRCQVRAHAAARLRQGIEHRLRCMTQTARRNGREGCAQAVIPDILLGTGAASTVINISMRGILGMEFLCAARAILDLGALTIAFSRDPASLCV